MIESRMRFGRVLLLSTLLACNSSTTSQSSSAKSAAPAGAAAATPSLCDKADKLQKRLAGIDAKVARVGIGFDVALPESKDGVPISSSAITVVIGAKEIRVNGVPIARPGDVKALVQEHGTVLLAIPKGTEGIDRLPDVVAAIGSERQIYLLATLPGTKIEAPPRGLDVSAKSASERATTMAQALTKTIATCPEAKKVFERLAGSGADNKADMVKQQLPGAVDACSCKVTDDLEELIAYLLGGDQPVIGKKLNLSAEKTATAIALKGLDGQKLYDALSADGAAVKLEK